MRQNAAWIASLMILGALLTVDGVTGQSHQPRVFAPGIVSVEGERLFRGSFSPNGQSFYFFRKLPGNAEDYRIWVTHREDGRWGPAQRVVLGNDGHSDLYPTLSPDGQVMVFSSYRPVPSDSTPQANIWLAEWTGAGWGNPVYLEAHSNPAAYNAGPVFDRHGLLRYKEETWGPDGRRLHLRARLDGGHLGPREPDLDFVWERWRDGYFVWDATFSPDRSLVILDVSERDPNTGRPGPTDLWVATRTGDGWTEPHPMAAVNTPGTENFAVFTPDGSELLLRPRLRDLLPNSRRIAALIALDVMRHVAAPLTRRLQPAGQRFAVRLVDGGMQGIIPLSVDPRLRPS